MFPFQQNNELFPQICSDSYQDMDPITPGQAPFYFTNNFTQEEEAQLPKPNYTYPNSNTAINNDDLNNINNISDENKITRKEIERQRRKQMSTLHASLRSLLPLQSLKGKRSMSDHINEAAKYIKHLQNNVEKMRIKRDKLKNLWDSNSQRRNSSHVTVRSHLFGVEIVVSSGCKEENFLLSSVLEAAVEEGFDVVSSISNKIGDRFYATIHCQASHLTSIDLSALQHKLNDVIS